MISYLARTQGEVKVLEGAPASQRVSFGPAVTAEGVGILCTSEVVAARAGLSCQPPKQTLISASL